MPRGNFLSNLFSSFIDAGGEESSGDEDSNTPGPSAPAPKAPPSRKLQDSSELD